MKMKVWVIGVALLATLILAGAGAMWFSWVPPVKMQPEQRANKNVTLDAQTVVSGLANPWEVAFLPDKTMIFSERGGVISRAVDGGKAVVQEIDDVRAVGEGGLTGLAVDANFKNNRFIYTCYNSTNSDVRVVRWKMNDDATALLDRTPIVEGIPATASGRHSGCRLKTDSAGVIWIGTGDAAQSANPQNLQSLGGKILRVNRDGQPVEGNLGLGDPRIFSYGHRNVQGIALFDEPVDGIYGYSIEHGTDEDDEVNLLKKGNFGWDPSPPYIENVPMTDKDKFPDAIEAIWKSGESTIAPSGGSILRGAEWGKYDGALAVAVLKNQHLRLLKFDSSKSFTQIAEEQSFEKEFGRIRSAVLGPDGLYLTTDNGADDTIIKVVPKARES